MPVKYVRVCTWPKVCVCVSGDSMQCCRARFMPVIFDEVMAGLYRLGAQTAASLLGCAPDISCHAKLMTAGVVPGAATMTTEDVFNAFQGDSKVRFLALVLSRRVRICV